MPLPAQIKPDTRTAHIEDNMLLSKRLSMVANAIPESQLTPGALANPNYKRIIKPLKSPIPPGELSVIEKSKQLAAWTAVDQHVKSEYRVIGIGSGSTVPYVVERIVSQGVEANKDRVFVPTGFQSKELIVQSGLTLGDVDQYPTIDVTIDGADEVDVELNCIKGGGACHLREKVIAEAALTWALYQLFHTSPASKIVVSRFILVADYRKNVEYLGTTFKAGVPIEVVPFAYAKVLGNLHTVIGSPKATLRMAVAKAGPVVTDNGNFIIDAPFDEDRMKDPYTIMAQIKMLTGVVEVGLFCHMAQAAYFGNQDGSVTVKWKDGRVEQVVGN
uniref:Ribose-5-phosphate isomerase n=1 Tax=Moniliophthora roreri TaxID=221103 RepID=A0A0W0F540_MONRR